MSSYPQHKENLTRLDGIGFDVSAYRNGEDVYDSWNTDELVDLIAELVDFIDTIQDINPLQNKED